MLSLALRQTALKHLLKVTASYSTTTTIDHEEITKFNKHGKQWWNDSSEVKLLLSMNEIRVPFIRDGLINCGIVSDDHIETCKPLSGLKVLDVGCGGGFLAEALARIGAETIGVDGSKDLIDAAIDHKQMDEEIKDNLHYEHTCIEDFSKSHENVFDAVVSSEVIEHVVNKEDFVKHCAACLKPGGSIFMTTINKTTIANVLAIFVAENILQIVPKGAHDYDKLMAPHELQRMFEENCCYTRRIHGFTYNPVTKRWCWIPSSDINYAIHAVKAKE